MMSYDDIVHKLSDMLKWNIDIMLGSINDRDVTRPRRRVTCYTWWAEYWSTASWRYVCVTTVIYITLLKTYQIIKWLH